jgi:hypothetical protein
MLHTTADEHTTTGCPLWDHWENYTTTQKQDLMNFAMSSMDSLGVILLLSELMMFSFYNSFRTGSSGLGRLARAQSITR